MNKSLLLAGALGAFASPWAHAQSGDTAYGPPPQLVGSSVVARDVPRFSAQTGETGPITYDDRAPQSHGINARSHVANDQMSGYLRGYIGVSPETHPRTPAPALSALERKASSTFFQDPDQRAVGEPLPVDTHEPARDPTLYTDAAYDTVDDPFAVPEPRWSAQGEPLIRYVVRQDSFRANLDRLAHELGWRKVAYRDTPACLDWFVEAPYIVQGPSIPALFARTVRGYPFMVTTHAVSRVVELKLHDSFTAECAG